MSDSSKAIQSDDSEEVQTKEVQSEFDQNISPHSSTIRATSAKGCRYTHAEVQLLMKLLFVDRMKYSHIQKDYFPERSVKTLRVKFNSISRKERLAFLRANRLDLALINANSGGGKPAAEFRLAQPVPAADDYSESQRLSANERWTEQEIDLLVDARDVKKLNFDDIQRTFLPERTVGALAAAYRTFKKSSPTIASASSDKQCIKHSTMAAWEFFFEQGMSSWKSSMESYGVHSQDPRAPRIRV